MKISDAILSKPQNRHNSLRPLYRAAINDKRNHRDRRRRNA